LDAVRLAKRLGCHTFIGAGSQAEYGRSKNALSSRTPTFPENGYGAAKLCAGQLSRILCEQLKMKHVWTRILSVYGPYDDESTLITSTIQKMLLQEQLFFTPGEQVWDFIYSEDAADILYRLALHGRHSQIYCIGSGEGRTLKAFIGDIRSIVGSGQKPVFGAIPYAKNQVMYLVADLLEIEQDIGKIVFTPFNKGIQKTMQEIIKARL
jgi:nucleoside-diphosphate-sugar epimerase